VCVCVGGEVYVITGHGRGSVRGDPKIKPAVKKYLDHNKIRYIQWRPN